MTDATTQTTQTTNVSIFDLANKALAATAPTDLSIADIIRLASWIVDHDDHVTMHMRALMRQGATGVGSKLPENLVIQSKLRDRIEPMKPASAITADTPTDAAQPSNAEHAS